ncbi:hypothetical protein Pla8534_46370 [Lignipirellula cremea]|uniref:Uncharacterized protein n=2 Tax=Lignipirellula cremea TaxID=2528010 RepID=A0A518DYE5_9BACT|nr:hypothetical protein Pla8534_46370 [Lignipirellula cremea]
MLLVTTFSRVLGPRYSEFDMFGVIGVGCLAAVVSCLWAGLLALLIAFRPAAALILLAIGGAAVAPALFLLALTFVDGEWSWFLVLYMAILLGTIAGVGASLLVPISANVPKAGPPPPDRRQ